MGRELRRVPPDWEHPQQRCHYLHRGGGGVLGAACPNGGWEYQPLHDESYAEACRKHDAFLRSWYTDRELESEAAGRWRAEGRYPWDWDSEPTEESYRGREWTEEEATAFQVYENISEGTPVSPVLLGEFEVKMWLLEQGYSVEAAEKFIEYGSAPSMVMTGDGRLLNDIEGLAL